MSADLAIALWKLFRTCDEWLASDGDDELFAELQRLVDRVWDVSAQAVHASLFAALEELGSWPE